MVVGFFMLRRGGIFEENINSYTLLNWAKISLNDDKHLVRLNVFFNKRLKKKFIHEYILKKVKNE